MRDDARDVRVSVNRVPCRGGHKCKGEEASYDGGNNDRQSRGKIDERNHVEECTLNFGPNLETVSIRKVRYFGVSFEDSQVCIVRRKICNRHRRDVEMSKIGSRLDD